MMLVGGLLSRPEITFVVDIDSVSDSIELTGLPVAFEDGEQFVFAVKTAHGIVAGVSGIFQLSRFHYFYRNFVLARKGERIFKMGSRQTGGICDHGAHFAAEHLMRRPSQKRGIHAAGICDD